MTLEHSVCCQGCNSWGQDEMLSPFSDYCQTVFSLPQPLPAECGEHCQLCLYLPPLSSHLHSLVNWVKSPAPTWLKHNPSTPPGADKPLSPDLNFNASQDKKLVICSCTLKNLCVCCKKSSGRFYTFSEMPYLVYLCTSPLLIYLVSSQLHLKQSKCT